MCGSRPTSWSRQQGATGGGEGAATPQDCQVLHAFASMNTVQFSRLWSP